MTFLQEFILKSSEFMNLLISQVLAEKFRRRVVKKYEEVDLFAMWNSLDSL